MIAKFFKALKAGEQLKSSAGWKNTQLAVNSLTTVLVFVLAFAPSVDMAQEDVVALSGVIVTLVGLFNTYITTATSKTVGVGEKE